MLFNIKKMNGIFVINIKVNFNLFMGYLRSFIKSVFNVYNYIL